MPAEMRVQKLLAMLALLATPTVSPLLAAAEKEQPAHSMQGQHQSATMNHGAAEQQRPSRGMRNRRSRTLMLANGEGAVITLFKPDLTFQRLPLGMGGGLTLKPTGMDNYHAVVAERDWGNSKEAVIRYETLRGEPSGKSPQALLNLNKTDLEIVPNPLPREHYRYYSNIEWGFCLRFQGHPLPDTALQLSTANGSTLHTTTGKDGCTGFILPDDFSEVQPGRRNNAPVMFEISAEYISEGKQYHTLFMAEYNPNPDHWRSSGLAAFVMLGGMFAGGLIGKVTYQKNTPAKGHKKKGSTSK